nr:MAG TPA: hypothetical protein [Bacteriophage sp.]
MHVFHDCYFLVKHFAKLQRNPIHSNFLTTIFTLSCNCCCRNRKINSLNLHLSNISQSVQCEVLST